MAIDLGLVLWRLNVMQAPKVLLLTVVLLAFADNVSIFTEDHHMAFSDLFPY